MPGCICSATRSAPANGGACHARGAPIEAGAPCAGTSNVDDRARMKCGWRLSEAVQFTHKPPSSAGYFAGPQRKDMRYSARRPRRLRILPYVISSGRVLVGSARRPNLQLDVFPVTHPLAPTRACTRAGWERSRTLQRSPGPPVLFLNSDRSRHPPRPCCKALRFGSCTP